MPRLLRFIVVIFTLAAVTLFSFSNYIIASHNENHGNEVITICHATESEANPYTKLVVSNLSQAGHFDNNGTPNSGHEDDLWFEGDVPCPDDVTPSPSPSVSPSATPTPSPTVSPSATPTASPSPSPTAS